ncbi:MAG: biopolymer transport protein ExbD [Saprospiraceae bacterium]|jgi:biopolymer transport protein ExbD
MAGLNKRRQFDQAINAGSMADIAFLLLIFFLVTTTIMNETGIRVRLPVWKVEGTPQPKAGRNVLSILVNASDELLVENQITTIEGLREQTKQFIMNPERLKTLASSPKLAIVSLQNDRSTSYKKYIEVYNELKAAYNELWEESSKTRFGKSYTALNEADRQAIRKNIPLVISEAEPTDAQGLR